MFVCIDGVVRVEFAVVVAVMGSCSELVVPRQAWWMHVFEWVC